MRRTMFSIPRRRFLLVTTFVICATAVAAAQSGRRGTSKPKVPAAPTVSDVKPVESKPEKRAELRLIVGVEDPSTFSGVPYYAADTVLDVCMRRLGEPSGVTVTAGSRRMPRGDAIKAAKAETAGYVVWLQVGNEAADSSSQMSGSDEYYVNYFVYEPVTAKLKQSGRVHYGARKVGNVGVGGSSRRSPGYVDYVIREEAREAADRILSAFGIRAEGWPR